MIELEKRLTQWFDEEHEILDEIAHDVATTKTVDEMLVKKQEYAIQDAKTAAIAEAIAMLQETK